MSASHCLTTLQAQSRANLTATCTSWEHFHRPASLLPPAELLSRLWLKQLLARGSHQHLMLHSSHCIYGHSYFSLFYSRAVTEVDSGCAGAGRAEFALEELLIRVGEAWREGQQAQLILKVSQ